jgi:hypothetical protein
MVSLAGDAAERATGAMESLILICLGQNFVCLGLQGLDLLGNHLQLGAQAGGDHLIRLFDFARKIDQPEAGRQAAHRVGCAVIGPPMDHRFIPLAAVDGHDLSCPTPDYHFTKHKFCVKYRVLSGRCARVKQNLD